MSTLKVDAIRHNSATSDAITTHSDGTASAKITDVAGGQLSNRNLFVNGACRINQRGTVTVGSGYGGPDRWVQYKSGSGAAITSQDTDVPTGQGFRNSIKLDVSTALASGSSNWAWIGQYIEAQDVQSVCKGTSNAKQLTLQFWVKSPKTGTHTVRLDVQDSSDGVGATYTVSSANTWEKKTVTFPASTSGTINDDTGRGIHVLWVLSAGTNMSSGTLNTTWAAWVNANAAPGQPNILDSTSNNFYLTGVQLEVGDTATSFEHRSYGEELTRCMRYYEKQSVDDGNGGYATLCMGYRANSTRVVIQPVFRVPKRSTNADFEFNGPMRLIYQNDSSEQTIDSWTTFQNSQFSTLGGYKVLDRSGGVGGSNGYTFRMEGNGNTASYMAFSSEL